MYEVQPRTCENILLVAEAKLLQMCFLWYDIFTQKNIKDLNIKVNKKQASKGSVQGRPFDTFLWAKY